MLLVIEVKFNPLVSPDCRECLSGFLFVFVHSALVVKNLAHGESPSMPEALFLDITKFHSGT